MYRLLAVLALAVCNFGCSACFGPGYDKLWGASSGGCGESCGCEDPYACGDGCGNGCCGECGCEPTCGCSSGECGQGGCCAGGVCGSVLGDCPLCQGTCCLFRRYGCDGCYNECSQCGGCSERGPCGEYDYSACDNGCGNGCGLGRCCCCGACCETYSGCCARCCQAQGPGYCASGDHQYNFAPGPPTGQTAYPYYTVRGPRDFLMGNPPSIGPY